MMEEMTRSASASRSSSTSPTPGCTPPEPTCQGGLTGSPHDPDNSVMRARQGKVRLRTGITVAYTDRGILSGPPLLLVHAWAESLGAFDPMVQRLPDDLRVLGFDQRGHGASDKPATGYLLPSLADDCAAFLDAREVSSAYVVGSSSGGYVAQQLAVSHPDRVRGLVLVGAPLSLEGTPSFLDEVLALRDPISPDTVRAFNAGMIPTHRRPGVIPRSARPGRPGPAGGGLAGVPARSGGLPATHSVGTTVLAPTLVLWGDEDQILGEGQLAGLLETMAQAGSDGTTGQDTWSCGRNRARSRPTWQRSCRAVRVRRRPRSSSHPDDSGREDAELVALRVGEDVPAQVVGALGSEQRRAALEQRVDRVCVEVPVDPVGLRSWARARARSRRSSTASPPGR